VAQLVKKSPPFKEPGRSLHCSQKPATGFCPESHN